jgi:hypothetical protein
MKKKTGTFTGIAVIALAEIFTLALAGCATTGGSGMPPAPDKQAEEDVAKLAADLNAIKAGSAVVEGAKVTLTTSLDVPAGLTLNLTTGLTVPAGVTLDLTADGAKFELQNGAELTVDGTVEASGHGDRGKGWVEGGLRIGDGETIINGSGTIRLQSKGRLLNIGSDKSSRHLTLDGVTLAGIADNSESLVSVDKGGELVLKSGAIMGNTRSGEDYTSGGGVGVYEGGTFTMEGGSISGNSVASSKWDAGGGGVYIGEGAVFTMTGGAISGNSAICEKHSKGGGVYVDKGTFTMEGGEISGNSITAVRVNGGGVEVDNGGAFTMKGGKISGNSANGIVGAGGGGVRVIKTRSVFTMEGGEISGNSAVGKEDASGGGVKVEGGAFTMQGGTISGNSAGGATTFGGGVYVQNRDEDVALFTMLGGTIYGNASAAGGNANETRDLSNTPVTGRGAAITVRDRVVAKWDTGGTYTKGGVPQTGGSAIGNTDDTLVATPAK